MWPFSDTAVFALKINNDGGGSYALPSEIPHR